MNRKQFLEQPDVLGLIDWLIENLPTLPVHLKVARSRFVRKAIDCKVQGIEAVQAEYQWGGNWETVKAELRRLRIRLRLAVRARDEFATHGACEAILAWGNVDGAVGFLKEQMHDKNLVNYLKQCQALLALDRKQQLNHLTKQKILRFGLRSMPCSTPQALPSMTAGSVPPSRCSTTCTAKAPAPLRRRHWTSPGGQGSDSKPTRLKAWLQRYTATFHHQSPPLGTAPAPIRLEYPRGARRVRTIRQAASLGRPLPRL
ncbi:hypothetical protein [Pseudomonas amygdali]|uniref:hypothetical protein n=2 Tax=Pseudomonas amygdali TaxID=47877 RepID=UPI00160553ED|nr:hypothetical protein [Pseudomonas amygdali]